MKAPSNVPPELREPALRRAERDEGVRPGLTSVTSTLGIVLKNDHYECARLQDAIDAFTKLNEFSEAESYALQLCLEEAIMNIVNYGCDDSDEHKIDIKMQFQVVQRNLTICIVDNGRKFESYSDSSRPDLDLLLQNQLSSDLGFHLVNKYMDHIFYCRQSSRNYLILSKIVSRESSSSAG